MVRRVLHRCGAGLLLGLWLSLCAAAAWAHKGSDAYLDVQASDLPEVAQAAASPGAADLRDWRLTYAVAIKDLDLLVPLDADADGRVLWGELKAAMPLVQALANDAVQLDAPAPAASGAACRLSWVFDGLDRRGDGTYVRLQSQTRCAARAAVALQYTLLRAQDANHRLLVSGRVGGTDLLATASAQPSPALVLQQAAGSGGAAAGALPAAASHPLEVLRLYFVLGVEHLLQGYDHLAFLLALVLPLQPVLFQPPGAAPRGATVRTRTWWALLRTVTAFTVGHSVTLVMATLGWTNVPLQWVEPAIALTIVFTALLNVWPLRGVRTDVLALVFGMVHGVGFAGLLREAAAPGGLLPWALGGFNLGVEAGQLLAVAAWVVLSQPMVAQPWYGRIVVRGGSVLLALLAAWWFWLRLGP
jgi:hypothetical protein